LLRVVFMGTPDFSVPTLRGILEAGHDVAAVYAQPPRPAGRGMDVRKSPVHQFADKHSLPVLTPANLKRDAERAEFAALGADVAVVVAYGLILPTAILQAPRHGCLNLHASDLPRWRGAAPIQRAIMAGDRKTAACVMRMDAGLDTGPVCLREPMPIGADMSAGELHDALAVRGAALMVNALARLEAGTLTCAAQGTEGVTYAAKIGKDETRIDFTRPAQAVHDHIRAFSPVPGAWFPVGNERVRVLGAAMTPDSGPAGTVLDTSLTVACGTASIRLITLQRAGKRPMPAGDFLRGFPLPPGARLAIGNGH
jgi:methionyl-tRNA formyltransferase